MTDEQEDKRKIVVDSDWKEQVQAEKDAARQAADQEPDQEPDQAPGEGETGGPPPGQLPPASFRLLVSSLATQALMTMGQIPDPEGNVILELEHAKHTIDMLAMLEAKTKGNLDAEETAMMQQVLHELRMVYVAISKSPMSPTDLAPPGE